MVRMGQRHWDSNIQERRAIITKEPYKSVVPLYLEHHMDRRDLHGHNTICSIIQEIYLITDDEEIKLRCRTAMTMSKKMDKKLKEYKERFSD